MHLIIFQVPGAHLPARRSLDRAGISVPVLSGADGVSCTGSILLSDRG